jgi:hypothetical protein
VLHGSAMIATSIVLLVFNRVYWWMFSSSRYNVHNLPDALELPLDEQAADERIT